MFELTMTALSRDSGPSVSFEKLQHIADFHGLHHSALNEKDKLNNASLGQREGARFALCRVRGLDQSVNYHCARYERFCLLFR